MQILTDGTECFSAVRIVSLKYLMFIYPAKHPFFILRILGNFPQTAESLAYRVGTSSKHYQKNLNSNGYVSTFTQNLTLKFLVIS